MARQTNDGIVNPRNEKMKRGIMGYLISNGNSTNNDIARFLSVSMPTAAKLLRELADDGYVQDCGKLDTGEGRRPNLYGINPKSGYFLGVDFDDDYASFGIIDFNGSVIAMETSLPFTLHNDMESLDALCRMTEDFIRRSGVPKEKILTMNVNVPNRVNPDTGRSYGTFDFSDRPLADLLEEKTDINSTIENDSRAMAYGELMAGCAKGKRNVLFINVSWGLGMGLIFNGKIYKGQSGFAGELGHIHAFDNEVLCHCGKKGCLETEVSGRAFHRIMQERLKAGETSTLKTDGDGNFTLRALIRATLNEDSLCIDIVEGIGQKLGQKTASLINILNPELVVIGGSMSLTGDYLLQAVRSSVIKYSLNIISKDCEITLSSLKDKGGVTGACMIARQNTIAN